MIDGKIYDELLFEGERDEYTGKLKYEGVKRGSIIIEVEDYKIEDDENGNLIGDIVDNGSIDYSLGEIDIDFIESVEGEVYIEYYSYSYYIYNLILSGLVPERYLEDEEIEVFLHLISSVIGQGLYYKNTLSRFIDSDEIDEEFLDYFALNIGYEIPKETNVGVDGLRLLIKNYLNLRRRRGTIESIKNAVRFAGRSELAILGETGGFDVKIEEVDGEGLYYIEGSNEYVEEINEYIKSVKPAGTKFTYSLRYNIPLIDTRQEFPDTHSYVFIDVKEDDLDIELEENSELENEFSREDNILINISELSSILNLFNSSDSFNVSMSETSNMENIFDRNDNLEVEVKEEGFIAKIQPRYGLVQAGNYAYGEGVNYSA